MKMTKISCAIFSLMAVVFGLNAGEKANSSSPSSCDVKGSCCNEQTFRDGWYMGVNGGVNFLCTSTHEHQKIKPFAGYSLGWELGYRWHRGIRLEIEEVFKNNRIRAVRFQGANISTGGHIWSLSTLVNALFEIPGFKQWCLTPYVGAGIGYAHQNIHANNFHLSHAGTKNGFAWQAIAGIGYWFNNRVDFAVEYRYREGPVTYMFDQTAQAAVKYHF